MLTIHPLTALIITISYPFFRKALARKAAWVLVLSLLSLGAAAQATETMIPEVNEVFVRRLVDTARANYPRVKSNAARVRFAQLQVQKERLSWFDVFSFNFLYSPNTVNLASPNFLNGYQVGLFVQFGRILQTPKNIQQARQQLKISEFDQQEYMLSLEAEVKSRYYTYLAQRAALRLLSSSANDASATVRAIRTRFERGEARVEEYNSALMMFAQQSQGKIQAEGTTLQSKARLEELLGRKLESL